MNLSDNENRSSEMEYEYDDSNETELQFSKSHLNNNNNESSKNYTRDHGLRNMRHNSLNSSDPPALSPSSPPSSRRNKRKNFKPRNIHEYEGSEEEGFDNCRSVSKQLYRLSDRNLYQAKSNHHESNEFDEEHEFLRARHEKRLQHEDSASGSEEEHEHPLDLSEVQNDSACKSKFIKSLASSSSPSTSASADNHELESLHLQSSSPHHQHPHHSFLHPSLSYFTPMDLRLFSNHTAQGLMDQRSHELNNMMNLTSCPITTNNISNNNNNCASIHDVLRNSSVGGANSSYPLGLAPDFAQSTMKELLGLYGIAENLRQGGVEPGKLPSSMDMRNYDLSFDPSGKLEPPKQMMLPEDMARFLAAVHESVNMTHSSNALRNCNSSSPHHNDHDDKRHSFPSPASILESSKVVFQNNNGNSGKHEAGIRSDHRSQHSVSNTRDANFNEKSSLTSNYTNTRSSSRRRNDNSPKEKPNQSESNSQSLLLSQANSKTAKSKPTPPGKSANFDLSSFPVIREGLLGKGSGPVDYTRYVRRHENANDCGYQHCQELNYKEHFHCLQCNEGARVFIKKDEMIRHFKWHKKRDESLQHGFMRYSSSDNCNDRFKECPHNRKQTHYHCIHDGCVKVYVSTSDVQMHSNYHRKDSAIIQEGFQRFRATEDCRAEHCGFRRQHTTHFHCRRDSCLYTFKNKADMEKHKAYHIKGEQMCRDGFKKFMKHEVCNYPTCRFSRVCNHIHCIRDGCNYVLHSSGQLYSHKRKHERRDSELAYRRFKLAQSLMRGTIVGTDLSSMSWSDSLPVKSDDDDISHSSSHQNDDPEESSEKQIEPCGRCELCREEHFHCQAESCKTIVLSNSEDVSEHVRTHELEDRISSLAYFTVDPANFDAQDSTIPCVSAKCPYQNSDKHYHCLWGECTEIILPSDTPYKRLEHFKTHEMHKLDIVAESQEGEIASLDGFFKRKRGRPLKNRTIEVPGPNESIFTSFKLPKPIIPGSSPDPDTQLKDPIGFTSYHAKSTCPDAACPFNTSPTSHYHCAHPRCHFAVKDVHKLSLHLRDFHSNVDILDGYEYYEKSTDCQKSKCEYNGNTSHFHCSRDDFVFERYSSMASHEAEHHEVKSNYESSSEDEERSRDESSSMKTRSSDSKPRPQESNGEHAMDLSGIPSTASIDLKAISDHSLSRILQLPETSETHFGPDYACGRPFCKLKRKYHFHCHLCNQAFSEIEKLRPHILKHSNLSASSPELDTKSNSLLRTSATELSELSIRKVGKDETNENNNSSPVMSSQLDISATTLPPNLPQHPNPLTNFLGYPTSHSPYLFLQQNPFSSLYAGMMFGQNYAPSHEMLSSQLSAAAGAQQPKSLLLSSIESHPDSQSPLNISNTAPSQTPLKRPPSNASSPSSPPDSKKQRMQLRILKDEPVPEGYVRFRFNEDCAYPHCGYREHQTHFHCTREDCGYSFCDKTRFVQHTARHDRLDSLMGGDFKQYRANVSCGRDDCSYVPAIASSGSNAQGQQNKASHFHCCKCDYVCTDTNKVVAHRRQHQKMDSITAAGFEKYTPSQLCNDDSCAHVQKQTHYHCVTCNFSVLGLSQMSAHKYRHDDEMHNSK